MLTSKTTARLTLEIDKNLMDRLSYVATSKGKTLKDVTVVALEEYLRDIIVIKEGKEKLIIEIVEDTSKSK